MQLHAPNVCITRAVHTEILILNRKERGSLFGTNTREHKHAERDDRVCRSVP